MQQWKCVQKDEHRFDVLSHKLSTYGTSIIYKTYSEFLFQYVGYI